MSSKATRRGWTLPMVMGLLTLAALTGAVISALPASSRPAEQSMVVTGADLRLLMVRLDLHPETLAAAGVTDQQAAALLEDARDHLTEHGLALRGADAAYAQARGDFERLRQRIQSGLATSEERTAYAAAATALEGARQQRNTLVQAALAVMREGLTAEQRTVISTIRANQHWQLPVQYLAVNRTEAQWVELRDALAHSRVQQARGGEVAAHATAVITQANSQTATVAANMNLETRLSALRSRLETAMAE